MPSGEQTARPIRPRSTSLALISSNNLRTFHEHHRVEPFEIDLEVIDRQVAGRMVILASPSRGETRAAAAEALIEGMPGTIPQVTRAAP